MRTYCISIASVSAPQGAETYHLELFPIFGQGCIVRGKSYLTRDALDEDLIACTNALETGLELVFARIGKEGFFTTAMPLTPESAKRLGWFE